MPRKMTITVEITSTDGEAIKSISERELPDVREFDTQGFHKSISQIETAVLEARKETSDEAVSEYISSISKKNRRAEQL